MPQEYEYAHESFDALSIRIKENSQEWDEKTNYKVQNGINLVFFIKVGFCIQINLLKTTLP